MPEARFSCTLHPPQSGACLWLLVQPGAAVAIHKRPGVKGLSSTPAAEASGGGAIDLEMRLPCGGSGRLRAAALPKFEGREKFRGR